MKPIRTLAAAIAAASASFAFAGEAVFYVTADGQPASNLAVSVDGQKKLVGKNGFVSFDLDGGNHLVELTEFGEWVGELEFNAKKNENAEIQVEMIAGEAVSEISVYIPGQEQAPAVGKISGTLESDETGGGVAGARISLADTEFATTTDSNGYYELEVPRGEYTLNIADPNYGKRDVKNIRVMANVATAVNMSMSLSGDGVIEEVVAVGSYIPSTATAQERDSSAVLDAIGSEQFARFGDSSAASALKRVAGVSVVGGQYAVVRGLQGRYISSTLNGSLMPSTDPMRRDVPLDLFPSSILGGIEIQKSYTPDLPGDTTGGAIRMTTKELPDEYTSKLKVTTGLNTRTTGSKVAGYEGGSHDYLGIDDGSREMPSSVDSATNGGQEAINICSDPTACLSKSQAADLGKAFDRNYSLKEETAGPDIGFSYGFGDRLDESGIGYYGSIQYKDETRARHDATKGNYDYERTKRNVDLSGYFVFGREDEQGNQWLSKSILLRKTDDTAKVSMGEDSEGTEIEEYTFQWVERQFLSQQFSAVRFFGDEHKIEARAGISQTKRDEPDRRSYQYRNGTVFPATLERRYSELTEDSVDAGLDYTFDYMVSDRLNLKIKSGVMMSNKERVVELSRFGIRQSGNVSGDLDDVLIPENFDNGTFTLQVNTTGTDSYEAKESMLASYLSAEIDVDGEYVLLAGARLEDASQELIYPSAPENDNELDSSELLPAISATWKPVEEWQFRFGYSNTLSRPGLTERSSSQQYDPETDDEIFGNPDLEISRITNLDLRAEYYMSEDESISLALFNKNIDKPIEKTVPDGSGSALDGFTYQNADSATINGVEIDFRKNVIDTSSFSGFLSGNVALVDSEVTLTGRAAELELNSSRALQGQSNLLGNLQFGLDHLESGQSLTLLANYFDERIDKVTRAAEPVMEDARFTLDLVHSWDISEDMTLSSKAKNITDAKVSYSQDGNVIESYYEGVEISVALEMIFGY